MAKVNLGAKTVLKIADMKLVGIPKIYQSNLVVTVGHPPTIGE